MEARLQAYDMSSSHKYVAVVSEKCVHQGIIEDTVGRKARRRRSDDG